MRHLSLSTAVPLPYPTAVPRIAATHAPRSGLVLAASALLVVLALGRAAHAEATTEHVQLRYDVGPGCPGRAAFTASVRARTQRVEFVREPTAPVLEIVAEQTDDAAWGEVQYHRSGQSGTSRHIVGDTCREVVSALALMAVVAVDPHANLTDDSSRIAPPTGEDSGPPPMPTPLPGPAASSTASAADPGPSPRPLPRPRWIPKAAATLELRSPEAPVPSLAVHVAVAVGLGMAPHPEARLTAGTTASPRVDAGPGQADFRLIFARLEASPAAWVWGPAALRGSVGFEIGQLSGRGRSPDGELADTMEQRTPWLAFVQVVRLDVALGRDWFVGSTVGVIEPLRSDYFYFERPRRIVHEVPSVGALAGLGFSVHLH